ncbi:MAG: hypothetical protein LBU87_01975 [Lactobacillales bacterium]|jgi:hypothetical protein|nr:hypothetical protein [Lactobacillales bacterium]
MTENEELKMYGLKVRETISNSGDTHIAAANKIGISDVGLRYVMKGRNRFNHDNFQRFCQIYGVSPAEFYFSEKTPSNTIDKKLLSSVLRVVEEWLDKKDYSLSPDDKTELVFALAEKVKNTPSDQLTAEIINLADFYYYGMKKSS